MEEEELVTRVCLGTVSQLSVQSVRRTSQIEGILNIARDMFSECLMGT